jgi:hypothetical protein
MWACANPDEDNHSEDTSAGSNRLWQMKCHTLGFMARRNHEYHKPRYSIFELARPLVVSSGLNTGHTGQSTSANSAIRLLARLV